MKLILLLASAALALLLLDLSAQGATFRWANTSNRIYVEGGGDPATLTEIKMALPNAPLDLVDSVNHVWLLRANLLVADGSTLLLHGTSQGGDVDRLLLQSNNSTNAGSFVTLIADVGTLDIRGTSISSWDAAVNGPDTEFLTFGRAHLRARSRLAPDGVTPLESRMDIISSDISYLGFDASESYGLSWKVTGAHPDPSKSIFDFVNVYGDIKNSRIHDNFWAVYTYGLKDGQWLNNELDHNMGYGFDLHDDSDNVLIEGNNVHHNGGQARGLHGIIASRRCDRLTIRNNRSWGNSGNGIMLHRHCDDCLVENNNSFLNGDSGVALFDSDRNIVRNNILLSNFNAGVRVSVGAADNLIANNNIGYSGKNGLYYFSGTDPGEPDPVDPTVTVRMRRNTASSNYIHHTQAELIKIGDSDNNAFIGNVFEGDAAELAIWTSTQIRFAGNTLPATADVRLFSSLSLSNTTTAQPTMVSFQDQPAVKLSLLDSMTSATFQDARGAIFDFDQPELATRVNSAGSAVTLTPAQIGGGTTAFMRNLFVSLDSGEARVNPTLWTISGDFRKQWTVVPPSASTAIRFTAGDLPPNRSCIILKNGQPLPSAVSDAAGQVSFADVSGTTSQIQYSVAVGEQPPPQSTVTVVASDASGSETAPNPVAFTFSRTGSTTSPLSVRYSVGGTALNGTDYEALPGSLTIPAGSLSAVLTINPIDDTAVDNNETIVITVSTNAAYLVGSPSSATATIADNDQSAQSTVTVTASDANASEGAGNPATFTFTRTGSTTAGLTVKYSVGGTAVAGSDYASLFGNVIIPAGSLSGTVTISPIDDSAVEGNETVVLTLVSDAAYVVGSPNSATVTIADNDQPTKSTVTVTASDANASESAGNPAMFTFTRTGSTEAALTLRYSVGGTAIVGADYQSLPGNLTIPAGSASGTVTISPIDDGSVEGNETVVVTLLADAGYAMGSPSSATVTIADNDQTPPPPQPTVTVTASATSATEGAPGAARFAFFRTGSTAAALAVRYSVGGTAANGTDYAGLSGILTIPAGSSSANLMISPIDDASVEGNETVVVTLSPEAGYVMGSPSSATITIVDNDQTPPSQPTVTVLANDSNATEKGRNRGKFTFSRTGSIASALTVSYSVAGSATSGTDYTALSGSVTILAGRSSAIVNVTPIDDDVAEGTETVEVTLVANGAYIVGSPNSATVTIEDRNTGGGGGGEEGAGRPEVGVTASNGSESGPTPGSFTFFRMGSIEAALTVRYSVGGTANNGTDYAALSGSVTIPPGSLSRTVSVNPVDDAVVEGNETVTVTLTADTGYTIGPSGSATATITDNDGGPAQKPLVSVVLTDLIASESGPDSGTFTVSRTGSTASALTVNYSLSGTAINGVDYQQLSGSVTIPAGADSAPVVVRPVDDTLFEVGEMVILTLNPNAAYDVLLGIAVLNILDNDILLLP